MTKIKRLVSVILAVLMIFGSVSVAAFAWDATTDDGFNLDITTKIFREVNGEWVETEKVKQGENVKARVYLNTDYYTNSGQILFFYDSGFFTDSFETGYETLTVNPYYASSPYGINGKFISSKSSSNIEESLVNSGKITSEFADSHEFVFATYSFSSTSKNQMLSSSNWFCEFPLTVKDDASGTGDFFALEETTASASFTRGKINVPKGPFNGYNENVIHMSNWDAVLNYTSQPVSLFTNYVTATFDAGSGKFSDNTSSKYYEGDAGEALTVEEPTRTNFRFAGWKLTGAGDSTASEVTAFPATSSTYEAVWVSTTASSEVLTFKTEFYRQDPATGEWIATSRVKPGEVVKARLFVDTSYFTNAGEILLFYDNDFFTDKYVTNSHTDLSVNPDPESSASINGVYGKSTKLLSSSNAISGLVSNGYISQSFADTHQAISISYHFRPSTGKKISGDKWFVEFDLQVRSTASGTGDIFVVEDTIMNSGSGVRAYINLPLSTDGGESTSSIAMHLWDVNAVIESNPVSTLSSVTFRANGGAFDADDTETYVVNGDISDAIDASAVPAISKAGATFIGWVPSTVENPTAADVVEVPSEIPYDDLILDALWIDEVDITFVLNNGQEPIVQTVTAGYAFAAPENPELEGNFFVGWTSDSTYKTITGLPDVYPSEDTTYYAVFETNSYVVKYYVLNKNTSAFDNIGEVSVSYGETIPHIPPYYSVPTGYTISEAYTDASFTNLLAADAKMPAKTVEVYYKTVAKSYDAVFDAGEGTFDDGASTATVSVEYGSIIVAPVAPTRDGYEFAGWDPDVGYMDEEGKTFNAIWTPKTYTATYLVDGAVYDTFELACDQEMEKPVPPYVEGYTFKGWTPEVPDTMPASNQVFNAVLEPKTYVATFDAGEGKFADDTVTVTVPTVFNTEIAAPAEPTREGYDFAGWTPVVPAAMPAENMTFTATWTARDDTPYTVEIYTMDTTGVYGAPEVLNKTGTTDKVVEITMVAPEGFYIDTTDSILSATVAADGTTVLKAYLARNEYTISFDANDGVFTDSSDLISGSYYHGAIVSAPVPTREGYTFIGWDKTVSTVAVASADYVAQWQINQYTITFAETGDSVINPITQDYGTAITAPKNPTKEGYTFDGWDAEIPATMPAESKTITAQWQINQYTITFAETGDSVINPITQDYGTPVPAPEDPTKVGYTFKGWDAEIPATMPAGDMTITGQWEINQYTITFGDTGDSTIPAITQDYGTAITAPENPTKEGYTFIAWSEEIPATMPAESKTITAQWQINQYTITFAEIGDSVINPITQDYGTPVTAPEDPTKVGYTFKGWDAEIPATMPAGDMTITGQWEINQYTITFGDTGDSTIPAITQDYGTAITAPENPTKEGYTFKGWDAEIPATMPAESKTITAQWQINQYTITFAETGDSVINPITQDYGTAITAPEDPTKVGYTFKGWDVEIPATMPADNMTITGQWEINQYTITFADTGDSVIDPITQDYDTAITVPENPTKTGYTFAGWVDENGDPTTIPDYMPAENLTITATWNVGSFPVRYTVDGETYYGPTVTAYGSTIVEPDVPTKPGYAFAGWLDADGKKPSDYGTMPAKALEFVAQWTPNENVGYIIEVYEMGTDGTYPSTPTIAYTMKDGVVGDTREFEATVPAGFVLDTANSVLSGTIPATDTLVLKAYYERNSHTLKTVVEGVETDTTVYYGAVIPAQATPVKEGYDFAGWVDDDNNATTIPAVMPDSDVTVYATFTVKSYTAEYIVDGVVVANYDVEFGAAIPQPADPDVEGMEFKGWTPTVPDTMPSSDLTFTAVLEAKTYTATFNSNDGAFADNLTSKTVDVKFGDAIAFAEEPTRTGYTFAGWAPSVPATMPAQNLTFEAQWAAEGDTPYKILTYTMDTAGNYGTPTETNKTGKSGEIVEVFTSTTEGFTVASQSTLSAVLAADGSTVLTVYLARNLYAISFDANGGSITGSADTTVSAQYYHGALVSAPSVEREGYTFKGWNPSLNITATGNANYAAQWEINEYTITFDTDGGSAVAPITQDYGTAINAPADPVKEGYTFAGWVDENGDPAVIPATMPAGDMTVTAQWNIDSYKVTWNVDGVLTEEYYEYGATINKPATPVKTGYVFAGWVDENGNPAVIPATMPARDLEFVATWTEATYTAYTVELYVMDENGEYVKSVQNLTGTTNAEVEAKYTVPTGFVLNDASSVLTGTVDADGSLVLKVYLDRQSYKFSTCVDGVITSTTNYLYGATVLTPSEPSKTGYTFSGWVNAVTGETVDFTNVVTMPAADMTVNATWTVNSYTITFRDRGVILKTDTYNFGEVITVISDPVRDGYTFAGWSPAVPATMPAKNLNPNAVWTANVYSIIFDTDGGTEIAPITQAVGTDIFDIPEDPTKEGYTFAGWSEEIPATMPVGGMTITATWDPVEYTITFGDTGDTVIAPITQDYGTAITAPEDPTKEGYTFTGWSEEIPATMPAENKTINAQWEINQYTITFDTNGGSAVAPITQDYGTAITAPENPTKEGYTFAGWSEAVPSTMPAENKTLTASWTVNTYTVTWNNEGTKTTADYNYGDTIVLPETPVKDGYTFFGWFDENGLQPSNYVTMPAKDIEFEARFTPNGDSSYIIEVYEMGTDGSFAATPSSTYTHSDGIVGNTKTVTPNVPNGFTLNTEKSVLSGVIPATGTLVLKVYYDRNLHTLTTVVDGSETDYGYYYNAVVTPVADPVKDGYVFAGWVDADNNATTIPTVMPDSDVKVYATWTNDLYTATFNAGEGVFGDGSSSKSLEVPFGGDITPPAVDPTREGYDFGGWATADDPTTPVTDFGTMGVGDRDYVAIWTKSSFKMTFYNYKPADGGPNAPTVKYALATAEYKYGETIDFPTDPSFVYYNFLGWSEVEGDSTNLITSADTITMPASDYNLYAVYEPIKVMLIPKNDTCTTIIDRNGCTVDDYTADSEWYVYGLEEYLTEDTLRNEYIDVQGDGYIVITPVDVNFGPYRGTGTVIDVYDRKGTVETSDDELAESFHVIIFGDLNGDAVIKAVDSTMVDNEVAGVTTWHLEDSSDYCAYRVKAADIMKDGYITAVDATLIDRKVSGVATIDQVTGLAS